MISATQTPPLTILTATQTPPLTILTATQTPQLTILTATQTLRLLNPDIENASKSGCHFKISFFFTLTKVFYLISCLIIPFNII